MLKSRFKEPTSHAGHSHHSHAHREGHRTITATTMITRTNITTAPGGHSHVPEGDISWRSLIALAISGGLVPCESALVLL